MKKIVTKTIIISGTFFSLQVEAQNVGIGTTTPFQKLEVAGNTFVRDSVGIGVANPQYKLDVGGRMRIRSKGNGDPFESAGIWFNNNTNTDGPAFVGMRDDNTVGLYGSGLENWGFGMNINTGNVGMGTGVFTPAQKLHVEGNAIVSGNVGIGISNPTRKLEVQGNTVLNGNTTIAGNTNISGFVGIGNNAPTAKLDVTGNVFVSTNITNGGNIVTFGNVGIGNLFPTNRLDVAGNMQATGNIKAIGNFDIGIEYRSITSTVQAGRANILGCGCPTTKKAIGGGGGLVQTASNPSSDFGLVVNASVPASEGTGWTVILTNTGINPVNVIVWAICAKVQ
jgi:hypothetical protein